MTKEQRRLRLGSVVATPSALAALAAAGQSAHEFLVRHAHCNWGEVSDLDWRANDLALQIAERVLSAYRTKRGVKLWIITEADRSATTILLPREY